MVLLPTISLIIVHPKLFWQIIRGRNACESGEELIDKLDRKFANDARLREKISFYVIKDPLPDPVSLMHELSQH